MGSRASAQHPQLGRETGEPGRARRAHPSRFDPAGGYHQCRGRHHRIGARCDISLLAKRGDTPAQSKLARAARAANVRQAFAASPRAAGLSLLLVDDVSTTGETIRARAQELLRAGAGRVFTCEVNPILAEIARQVVAEHGLSDVVTVIGRASTGVTTR